MPLLELHDVEARYGQIKALHGVSLAVEEGEVVAILGANGAGKTTTLRAVSGLVRPRRRHSVRGTLAHARPPRKESRAPASRTFPKAAGSSAS